MDPHSTSRSASEQLSSTVLFAAPSLTVPELLHARLMLQEDWDDLTDSAREEILRLPEKDALLRCLVEQKLLTEYQAARLASGKLHGMMLGNYRVLDRLGAGGMGIVFKGEHVRMRRQVAIKVLPLPRNESPDLLRRFYSEVRAVAQLQHPNIVAAFDAGETSSLDPDEPVLHYYVMEYVPGLDLEQMVNSRGPLSPAEACDFAYQVAAALAEAHQHNLVHRDIKPSNVLVTPEGQAKLLDFGLARGRFRHRLTEPGAVLGTIDFMAPEQVRDASSVDIRADIYGLGGTLYWCLTGRLPFPPQGDMRVELTRRLMEQPPSIRSRRPEVPAELDAVVARMMALNVDDRYPTPEAVMRVLLSFLRTQSGHSSTLVTLPALPRPSKADAQVESTARRILIVDDEDGNRSLCRYALEAEGFQCDEAIDGPPALAAVQSKPYDLVLLDVDMPQMKGTEVLRRLRETPPAPHLKVIMFSGRVGPDEMSQQLSAGADDCMSKPFTLTQLRERVKAAFRLKESQERTELLTQQLLVANRELEQSLDSRASDLISTRNALVLALAELGALRESETSGHLVRLQRYCRCLSEEAGGTPSFSGQIDGNFVQTLEGSAPLHDIGKVGLPDHILLKAGKLDPDERLIMQTHTTLGADVLLKVARRHGTAVAFLQMAIDIARHHHERFDGTGYPDRLSGTTIPLSARVLSICDVYDALRSRRSYKPALSHAAAVQIMSDVSQGQFDPALLQVFHRAAKQFEQIFKEVVEY